jgi:hypothetical protein
MAAADHRICFLVRYTSINSAPGGAGGDTGRAEDPKSLAARIKSRNLVRQVCDPSSDVGDDAVAIEEWARFAGADAPLPTMEPMPPRLVYGGHQDSALTVLHQLQTRIPMSSIVGHPTPIKQLCEELRHTPHKSVLEVLYKNHYSSKDAISMGAEFGMITCCVEDWNVILDKKFFTPYELFHLGFTFTRMLLAGMDLDLFSYAGMDHIALHIIRFSMRAFRCARGTSEQLARILGEGGIKDYSF